MNIIRAVFPKNQGAFFNFQERAGETLTLHPASCCALAVRKGNSWAIQSELLVR